MKKQVIGLCAVALIAVTAALGGKRGTECPPEWHAAGTDGSTGANSRTGTEHTGSSAVRTSAAREKGQHG